MYPMLPTPDLVARIRAENGDTQEGLARRMGVSFPTVNAWERGRSEPSARHRATLDELATELGIVYELVILVIDDDPVTNELVVAAAQGVDASVVVEYAANGWEGLVKCGALKPSLLFLDIMMPGIDGLEVARRLPTVSGLDELRVVFVTSSESPDVLARAASLGNAVMGKPLEIDALAETIRESLAMAAVR